QLVLSSRPSLLFFLSTPTAATQLYTLSLHDALPIFIESLWDAGAGGVILGCTELELLVKQSDVEIPVFASTSLHVKAAIDRALRSEEHTSELQSRENLVCRLLLEKKKKTGGGIQRAR